ncbi:hypothetical protein PFMALIP_00409 [Plasmodium falciparum MaliPS096_E11]|uniref:Uncharacterized protein n=1 Tax=Plasmodium falciparum MaliPS096_E11 TaxID=1036727 RepID=A0A024WY41_PLAFA|nr:hypothetical protein PFMALIP_00409 [Plasmodium falciparum MaliPS096_E11]
MSGYAYCKEENHSKYLDTEHKCKCNQYKACDIVKEKLKYSYGQTGIDGCNKKGPFVWNCDNTIDSSYNGVCMPPRRQKLFIYNLTDTDQRAT